MALNDCPTERVQAQQFAFATGRAFSSKEPEPDVKDFATEGFPLVGGRLDYLNGRRVAALIYRRDKHLINVFVWADGSNKTAEPPIANRRGYCVINRETNGLHYCLVSDLNPKELNQLANLLGQ